MAKKKMSEALKKKLNSLRRQGKKAAKKEKVKPYYFSGKKRKRKKASPAQLRALAKGRAVMKRKRSGHKSTKTITKKRKAGGAMATKKRAHKKSAKRRASHKDSQVIIMNSRKRRRKSSGRMHGKATGRGSAGKNLIHNGINTAAGIGGALAAGFAANKIPVADPKIKAGILTAAGLLLTTFIKNDMVKAVGLGMSIMGGTALVRQFAPQLPLLGEEKIQLTDQQVRAIERELSGAVTDYDSDMEGSPLGDDDEMEGAVTDFSGESPLGYVVANQ